LFAREEEALIAIGRRLWGQPRRLTEFLIRFERDNFIIRDGRHLIVHRDRPESFLAGAHPPRLLRVKQAA
jgi:hypothetical protein